MSIMSAPPGILCSVATPFDSGGRLDLGAHTELLKRLAAAPVQGIFLLGTAGEAMLMTIEEREAAVENAMNALAGKVPVLVHVGTADTPGTVRLARHAMDAGATALAAIAPYYFRYGPSELAYHYGTLSEAVPDAAVYVYDNPDRVGYTVGVTTVTSLVKDFPNVVGVKDTGDSLGRVIQYLAGSQPVEVYVGNNDLILSTLEVGGRGVISALSTATPEIVGEIYRAWMEGRDHDARQTQMDVTRLMLCFKGLPYLGSIKWLARRRGLPVGLTRPPQQDLDDGHVKLLESRLGQHDSLERWLRPM